MFKKLALIMTMLLTVAACSAGNKAPDISVENSRLRLPAPGQTTGAVYFDVINNGGADLLLSAKASYSPRVELHTHLHEDGMMKMRPVDNVPIGARETVHFKSGGLHIMLFDLDVPKDADTLMLSLNFETSGIRVISVPVTQHMEQRPQMNHEHQ